MFITLMPTSCKQSTRESRSDSEVAEERVIDPVAFDLEKIKERGTLRAIIDNSSTGYFVYKGQPMGYEYELLTLLADHLEVKLEILPTVDIDEAFTKLNKGEGDIIAHNLTITKDRKEKAEFTDHLYTVKQVLVQRKPDNWRKMKRHQIEDALVRNPIDLIGREVYVRKSSSYFTRLENLSEEVGGDIIIVEDFADVETERLIRKVAEGDIEYTVADEDIAMVNATYYSNLDVKTAISFPQRIAWGVRKNAPGLLTEVNAWLERMKKKPEFYVIYKKYFKNNKAIQKRGQSQYASFAGNKISPYDSLIKDAASTIGWDWRLLAAQVYQESKFDPYAQSWAGAVGLMQLMPSTAETYGAKNLYNPNQSLKAGTKYIEFLQDMWLEKVADSTERVKFVLASYNVGAGHVLDARALCRKYGKDPENWEDVEYYLVRKSKPKYFKDPVVNQGYCRGEEPAQYVRNILEYYDHYNRLTSSNQQASLHQLHPVLADAG
ncbi:transporter substrate-binding domain-containing protein [Roseivirga sp. BDSF3-8]|uniref:transporter substrate-binding domain-containing protein n=1 Tax=Roseivirga sp. BDSF3-8 TaxID=3241598 RepID=UPI0035326392